MDLYRWRCTCGERNNPQELCCAVCEKQRWSQLGLSREGAEELLDRLVPDYILYAKGKYAKGKVTA